VSERARRRWRPSNFAPPTTPLRVSNALGTEAGAADLYLYDAIDEWGGEWGVSSSEFVAALSGITAGLIRLHLNSPGGSYYEAIAMRAALVAHPATVHVYVDGLAASAASILATVGERGTMAPGSQQMIH
jgi:ATP-dependent protease ClpP protease subunit